MKGERVGNVGTWPKQPLVIVNYGEATGDEVLAFSTSIIEKIREKTGIVLEREVNFVK
jgi:UDP-N-acetylmuramate dehydrogenase